MGRGDSERAFRAAVRHSRLVRVLRVAIPLVVLLLFAAAMLATWFNPFRMLAKLPVGFGDLVVSGTRITMEQPRLSGYTRDARAYELTARAAAQDVTKPDLVELQDIHAKIEMQDKTLMEMSAVNGVYDAKAEMLTLGENILLKSSTGYQGRLSEAVVDIRKGNIVSEKPVEVTMLNGTLNANRLEVVDAGDLVRFDGGVAMTLMLNYNNSPPGAKPSDIRPSDAKSVDTKSVDAKRGGKQ
jgi:lipopolysaccharide export system protein LptC